MAQTIKIGGELESIATGNKVADVTNIKDKTKGNKTQFQINAEVEEAIGADNIPGSIKGRIKENETALAENGSVDQRIAEEGAKHYLKTETYNKTELNSMITTPSQEYVSVTATDQTADVTDVLPATGEADTVYRVGNWDGSQFDASVYSEYAWNGSQYVHLSTKTQIGEVFDISVYHATGGELAKYADLAVALNGGTNIPQSLQKGGMSIKFIQSFNNKYVQYRLMADTWSINTADWSFCGNDIYVENPEFVKVELDKDGRILRAISKDGTEILGAGLEIEGDVKLKDKAEITSIENPEFTAVWLDNSNRILYGVQKNGNLYFGCGVPKQIVNYIESKIAELSLDEYEDIVNFLNGLEKGDETLQDLLDKKVDGEYIENPEFIQVVTDSEGRVIEGTKNDGTKVLGGDVTILGKVDLQGVTYTLMQNPEWIRVIVDAQGHILCGIKADGSIYLNSLTEIPSIIQDVINNLSERINPLDELFSIIDNQEYIAVETDSEGKMLSGRNTDGSKFENLPMEFKDKVSLNGNVIQNIQDPEGRTEIKTDSEQKIIYYRDSEGVLHENVGIETNSLMLTDEGMTEFQQALKDAGFHPGGAGDYTDKESMYIPEPRLAHLNIITDFDLTTLTKTSDVKCQVEFTDGAGNYFKKWIILNGQGRSSLEFIKKGLGADFFNEDPNAEGFDEDNVFTMKFGDWIPQDSFHIKSFYTDWPRCTTPIVYKLMDEVLRTRGVMEDRPYKKYYVGEYSDAANANTQSKLDQNMETGARCVPDGFPVIIYQNGVFWGVNSWQLKKHRDNYMLNKKKDTNIHLDGDMGTSHQGEIVPPIPTPYVPFWLWNGNIDWTVYCSGKAGIETRNPKNLYCIDGKKYDADTHDAEIITTATAEEWIAAGKIIPTDKPIDDTLAGYLRTTGKVRKHIEDLTTYIPYINGLIDGSILIDGQQATTEQIKAAIEDRFDVASFIDYIVLNNVVGNNDAWDNNGQIITWGKLDESDNLNWSVNVYDCDITFGCVWNGKVANSANNYKLGLNYPLYKPFWDYYFEDLKARYAELRDAGIFTAEHITQLFRSWMNRVGYDNYSKEFKKWPETPCFRDGSKTYTTNPTTGGFYGSIERIYLWVKKRIEYMDAVDFFDYNN